MNGQYEVLSPWAEADLIPLRGISPRVADLKGKAIGLLCGSKVGSRPILTAVEKQLKERYPTLKFSWFDFGWPFDVTETEDKARFEEWVKGADAVIAAVGD